VCDCVCVFVRVCECECVEIKRRKLAIAITVNDIIRNEKQIDMVSMSCYTFSCTFSFSLLFCVHVFLFFLHCDMGMYS
jgi:hypothetical protein